MQSNLVPELWASLEKEIKQPWLVVAFLPSDSRAVYALLVVGWCMEENCGLG